MKPTLTCITSEFGKRLYSIETYLKRSTRTIIYCTWSIEFHVIWQLRNTDKGDDHALVSGQFSKCLPVWVSEIVYG